MPSGRPIRNGWTTRLPSMATKSPERALPRNPRSKLRDRRDLVVARRRNCLVALRLVAPDEAVDDEVVQVDDDGEQDVTLRRIEPHADVSGRHAEEENHTEEEGQS